VLQVKLHTGRKHQIRVHLKERGWPIVGDVMYGKPDKEGLHLAATTLEFDHPRTGERMQFRLPPPDWLR
jgi:23S rRNA pseudouridine1911/1915/1917 synthase